MKSFMIEGPTFQCLSLAYILIKIIFDITFVDHTHLIPGLSLVSSTCSLLLALYASHWLGMTTSVTSSYTCWSFDNKVLCPEVFSCSFEKLNQAGLLWLVATKLDGVLEMPRLPMLEAKTQVRRPDIIHF